MKRINKVAVLGAGTMGARIAAHFANAGVPSYLFDIVPPDADGAARNKIAAAGLDAAKKSKPAAFMEPSLARFVTVGNFEDDLQKLAEVDWIIEAVVENLELKRSLLRKVEAIRKPGTIVTTNTSGLLGLDIRGHVVSNETGNAHDERSDFRLPRLLTRMLWRKWLGDKTRRGC